MTYGPRNWKGVRNCWNLLESLLSTSQTEQGICCRVPASDQSGSAVHALGWLLQELDEGEIRTGKAWNRWVEGGSIIAHNASASLLTHLFASIQLRQRGTAGSSVIGISTCKKSRLGKSYKLQANQNACVGHIIYVSFLCGYPSNCQSIMILQQSSLM